MSACFAYGLAAGKPIAVLAKAELLSHQRIDLWQNLPVLIVVMLGGFTTNFLWCIILLVRNHSARQYLGFPADASDTSSTLRLQLKTMFANYAWAALAGITWYFQFFFYSMGETKMGKYEFSSWTLHMASIMIFAMLIGIMLHEWRGTSVRTRTLVAAGLFFLLASTVVVGYGNYIKANQTISTVEAATVR